MNEQAKIIAVDSLGEPAFHSPLDRTTTHGDGASKFVGPRRYVRSTAEIDQDAAASEDIWFEKAGARQRLFFDPGRVTAAIVTCGGLCPGLNNVVRSVFLELRMLYGVPKVLGIRYGYQGLVAESGLEPLRLSMEVVEKIHREGGTVLGSSRGNQDPAAMVDFLVRQGINILLCVGGDGTQRGAHKIATEVKRRGLKIAVVGIPKTIDNDISCCERTFGFTTAVAMAEEVIDCAHVESKGSPNGIGLVKLMGRDAGFIAAAATVASQEVNFTLVPEVPFALQGDRGLLAALRTRIITRRHAVIVVAEGAGQNLFADKADARDASGNVQFQDIGLFLKDQITAYFAEQGPPVSLKYMDPSYLIRSVPANAEDDILCDQYGRRAVHAAMAGKTDMLIGHVCGNFVHVPLEMAVATRRRMNVEGELWSAVLSATGQPRRFE